MGEDNWKHRTSGMKCGTCMFFVIKARSEEGTRPDPPSLGRCRAQAPTMRGWPAVFDDDWCGFHKLDEDKI